MSETHAIEGKYGEITSSKKKFWRDEPVFLIRAQDPLASEAVAAYAELCEKAGCTVEHVDACHQQRDRIKDWQQEHPALVKSLPGVAA